MNAPEVLPVDKVHEIHRRLLFFTVTIVWADSRGYEAIDLCKETDARSEDDDRQKVGRTDQGGVDTPQFRRKAGNAGSVPPV